MDSTVFGPYKSYYNACLNDTMFSDPGKALNRQREIFQHDFTKHNSKKYVQNDTNSPPKLKWV